MPMSFKAVLFLASVISLSVLASPAQAKWETVHGHALSGLESCPDPHDRYPNLRASDGRPFEVPAGFSGTIEIYGQGIDLSPDAAATGLPGLSAIMRRKVGGPQNAFRHCGSIGSVVVELVVTPNAAAATGSLRIGPEVVPLRIVNATISGAAWSEATNRLRGSQYPKGSVTAEGEPLPDYPSGIGECIDKIGGAISPNVGFAAFPNTLTLTLPRGRGDAELACLTRPAIFEVRGEAARGDVAGFRAGAEYQLAADYQSPKFFKTLLPPRYSGTTSGLTGPVALAAPDVKVQTISMTSALAQTFVGERTITLASAASGANPLTLVLRSNPYNGIRSIQGVPLSGTRLLSKIDISFDFLAAFRGPETVAWRLGALNGPAVQTCFAATNGTMIATAEIGRLVLTATEAPGCAGSGYLLQIAPAVNGAGVFAAPFFKNVIFTLTARSAQVDFVPPQRATVPPR